MKRRSSSKMVAVEVSSFARSLVLLHRWAGAYRALQQVKTEAGRRAALAACEDVARDTDDFVGHE